MNLSDIYDMNKIADNTQCLREVIKEQHALAERYGKQLKRLSAQKSIIHASNEIEECRYAIENAVNEIILLTTNDDVEFARGNISRLHNTKCDRCNERIRSAPVRIARAEGNIAVKHFICGDAKYY